MSRSPTPLPWISGSQAHSARFHTATVPSAKPIAWPRRPASSDRYDGNELSPDILSLVAAYVRSLKAPTPSADKAGASLFAATGCAACHVPEMPAAGGGTVAVHTDLLLHDMGAALDDGVGEPGVASAEWRTAPLIAMAPGGGRRYLHDGRAATVDAAIRAHGGEAGAAVSRYLALSDDERRALAAYVESL